VEKVKNIPSRLFGLVRDHESQFYDSGQRNAASLRGLIRRWGYGLTPAPDHRVGGDHRASHQGTHVRQPDDGRVRLGPASRSPRQEDQ
jgi:hypothetical protein